MKRLATLPAGQVEPGKAWRPPRAPFPVKRWRSLVYGLARFVTVSASWAHIVSVSRGRAELWLCLLGCVCLQSCAVGDNETNSSVGRARAICGREKEKLDKTLLQEETLTLNQEPAAVSGCWRLWQVIQASLCRKFFSGS